MLDPDPESIDSGSGTLLTIFNNVKKHYKFYPRVPWPLKILHHPFYIYGGAAHKIFYHSFLDLMPHIPELESTFILQNFFLF
jgi:hypothetical protein